MSLDDLLGLLFLLFFIVLPALQGLSRKAPPPGFPLDLPEPEPLPPAPKPRPKKRPKPPEPPKRPLEATPEPLRSLEAAPREALKVTFREAQEEVETPRKKRPRLLSMEKNEILKGMVWHEILKPPKGW
ncbi:hypothetical protein ACLWNE_07250 [Thermus oshimai]|uniref:Uncharacterized protein n=1 Tax=Thermus oshimai JL-2 TaxID=751945 RepID=K7R667_THEOS|nr:hypothetical protein [Thermus oshimai]AFV76439.1 hypothetical protein Theos_1407 [Thermus oshimai JL-2]